MVLLASAGMGVGPSGDHCPSVQCRSLPPTLGELKKSLVWWLYLIPNSKPTRVLDESPRPSIPTNGWQDYQDQPPAPNNESDNASTGNKKDRQNHNVLAWPGVFQVTPVSSGIHPCYVFFFSLLCQFILLSSSRNLFAVCLFFRFLRVPTLAILKPLLCRSVWPRTDRDQPASASASQALGLKLFAKSPARQEFQSTKNIFIKFGINRNITSIC